MKVEKQPLLFILEDVQHRKIVRSYVVFSCYIEAYIRVQIFSFVKQNL